MKEINGLLYESLPMVIKRHKGRKNYFFTFLEHYKIKQKRKKRGIKLKKEIFNLWFLKIFFIKIENKLTCK